jgi:hypothetical protein
LNWAYVLFTPAAFDGFLGNRTGTAFSSAHDTQTALHRTGYITDEITATIVYLAAKLNKPVLGLPMPE